MDLQVEPGGQGPNSVEIIEVPAKISGLEVTKNIKQLISDIRKREMDMVSVVTIKGHARLWKWTHRFEVRMLRPLNHFIPNTKSKHGETDRLNF